MSISTGNRTKSSLQGMLPALMLAILACSPVQRMLAQEPVIFGQHLYNRMLYNPAYAGERAIPGFTMNTRQQWISWEGSPSSNVIAAHTRLKNKNAAAGILMGHDRLGPLNHTGITGIYSYALELGETRKLYFGLQGEIRFLQLRLSGLELVDQGDPAYAEDPGLKPQPNVGIGTRYVHGNFQLNLSVPRLMKNGLSPVEGETSSMSRSHRMVFLGTGWSKEFNEDLELEPSLLIALARGVSPFVEVAGLLHYQEKMTFGSFYRFNRTLGAMVRYKYQERWLFGYSYDLSLGKLRNNVGTHELFLGYNFPFNRTKTLSPRRF